MKFRAVKSCWSPLVEFQERSKRMKEPTRKVPKQKDRAIFQQRSCDPAIVPDRVSPAVEGYFRMPAVWIGEKPDSACVRGLNPIVHHAVVLSKKLNCGIQVQVQRDGTFLFDFSSWPAAPLVIIPGFRKPNPNDPQQPPLEHQQALELAESYAIFRAQVMNAHQACLTTSERLLKNRGAMMGFPVTASNTHKALDFNSPPFYHDDVEDLYALGRNVMNNKDLVTIGHPLPRRVIEIDVTEHSLGLLDDILRENDPMLIQIVESAYMASCRSGEHRYGEALILAWGVCEMMIYKLWKTKLQTEGQGANTKRMNKKRIEKLTVGRDYTASIVIEILELFKFIDNLLYILLGIARKARNDWVHEFKTPRYSEINCCLSAVERLLFQVVGVQLSLQSGGRGGVPQWPVWMWEEVQAHRAAFKNATP